MSTISTAPLPATILFYTELLAKKLNLNFNRTNHCKHRGSCVCSCLASSTKAGFLSYLIKAGISTVFNIKKILKSPKNIINGFTNKDSIKFGLFICFFLLLFRTLVCFLRRKTEPRNHKFIFLIGGFIGATASAFILEKKTRQAFGLFLIARAIDISYRSLVEKKIIPDYKYFYPVLYGLMMVVTGGLALGHEPASMSP